MLQWVDHKPIFFGTFTQTSAMFSNSNFLSTSITPSGTLTDNGNQISKKGITLADRIKLGSMFGLWYAFNVGYNVYNKHVLNTIPELTYTVAFVQLFVGLLYVLPMWQLKMRKAPVLTNDEVKALFPIAVMHSLTHLGAVVSLGAGTVSFTSIVKAAEPAASALLSAVLAKSFLPIPVYLTLLPVMVGVAMASLTELTFSWLSFGAAMVSNFASAARGILSKKSMNKSVGENMTPINLYGVLTVMASALLLPLCLVLESNQYQSSFRRLKQSGLLKTLGVQTFLSGVFYYLYNEVAFLTLDKVSPVTHAVGNTIKRVVIIITSMLVFGTTMTQQGALGSALALVGVLLYSLAQNAYK